MVLILTTLLIIWAINAGIESRRIRHERALVQIPLLVDEN